MVSIIGILSGFFADLILQGWAFLTGAGVWPYILCGFAMVCVTRFILLPLYGGETVDLGRDKGDSK